MLVGEHAARRIDLRMPGAVAVCCVCTGSSAPGCVMSNAYTPVGASTAYAIEPKAATSRA